MGRGQESERSPRFVDSHGRDGKSQAAGMAEATFDSVSPGRDEINTIERW